MNSVSTATKSRPGEPFAELFEGLGIGDQRMDMHLAALIAAASALDKAPSRDAKRSRTSFPQLNSSRKRSTMHAYRTHNCGELRESRCRRARQAVGLGAPQARPWRRAVRRPARPLRPHPDRRRRRTASRSRIARASARRIGGDGRGRGRRARRPRRPTRTCRPAQIEVVADEVTVQSAAAGAAAAGRRRGRIIPRISAFATAISTCGASGSTPTSCCAAR